MRRVLRLLLVLCVALALPLQGIAAVTRLACAQHAKPDQRLLADGAGAVAEAMDTHAHHAAQHPAAAADHADGAPAHGHAAAGHGTHKCSACAACSVGVAMVASVSRLAVEPLAASAAFAASDALAAPFVTDGPDRPPRDLRG